ncbi:hypothetical protein B4U80_02310 [Leptotrombidium deliense]|uniref:Uncharacterized protein n=1 Tax=Leptotrombidium deliense TaxID=299467 RepID=A0A443SQU7_9ACAR|nr:hypothetical protein B4U80_02310 [Leptotrombidium deliense]
MAIFAGAVVGQWKFELHHLGRNKRRVQIDGSRRSGTKMGREEK